MLSVWRLGDRAFGSAIRDELLEHTGRSVTVSSIYSTLMRLEERRLIESSFTDPTPVRGGKARRCFGITPAGVVALKSARREMEQLWEGLDKTPEYGAG